MTTLLHLDASARGGRSDRQAHGSHTRRLTHRFVQQWLQQRPGDQVSVRDVGLNPPSPVSGEWIHAAFTAPALRASWMHQVLAESDMLVDEILAADILVLGVPMYNFNVPAQFKSWIDNIVRVGRTFGFDRQRQGEPYWPMLQDAGKRAVVLSSRGDYGYGAGQRIAAMNHVEPSIRSALSYIGINEVHSIAVEYDEFGDERLAASIAVAEAEIAGLVSRMNRDAS
ncbi:FMN-dependent NADH-azoreductase 1 [Collimonas fungivorans]|uniref:FMN dependent NADH:quinone oxidoreductase n=1 Tax=Collimonas fungivorans TaxID=158899 RepID=A0A127PAR8_9BURK|nr:NAD(P)H-dependent oxidoreductase [Collimonas fungivorans]AMO94734.1 FMN-dependent NADH-azoreductase 1 [Collimonas fungivorans]